MAGQGESSSSLPSSPNPISKINDYWVLDGGYGGGENRSSKADHGYRQPGSNRSAQNRVGVIKPEDKGISYKQGRMEGMGGGDDGKRERSLRI